MIERNEFWHPEWPCRSKVKGHFIIDKRPNWVQVACTISRFIPATRPQFVHRASQVCTLCVRTSRILIAYVVVALWRISLPQVSPRSDSADALTIPSATCPLSTRFLAHSTFYMYSMRAHLHNFDTYSCCCALWHLLVWVSWNPKTMLSKHNVYINVRASSASQYIWVYFWYVACILRSDKNSVFCESSREERWKGLGCRSQKWRQVSMYCLEPANCSYLSFTPALDGRTMSWALN
jgi:hypothetical protein